VRFSRVPVLGWLLGAVVVLALVSWSLLRRLRLAQRRLAIEARIRATQRDHDRRLAMIRDKGSKTAAAITKRTATRLSVLDKRKEELVRASASLDTLSESINKVFER